MVHVVGTYTWSVAHAHVHGACVGACTWHMHMRGTNMHMTGMQLSLFFSDFTLLQPFQQLPLQMTANKQNIDTKNSFRIQVLLACA